DAPDAAPFEVAVKPLVGALGDRVKMVSRAAAWSLRQLGNDGLGIDEVKAALASDDDYTRRGAARVFYQYAYHMSGREDVARALSKRASRRWSGLWQRSWPRRSRLKTPPPG